MGLHIGICDYEQVEIEYIKGILSDWSKEQEIQIYVDSFNSAESFLFEYAEDKTFDILLLDIQMSKMDGVALAKEVRKRDECVQIVFITGFPDFMAEGYEVSALHYLMKPVDKEKLYGVLDKAVKGISKQSKRIYLQIEGESLCLGVKSIQYIEAFDHMLSIQSTEGQYAVKMPLYEMEAMLTENFVRCHRCCAVNLDYVKKITKLGILMDSGKELPISRRLYPEVNRAMMKYLKNGEEY